MARKKFKIRARISFSGRFEVEAHSRQEAEEIVEKSIGAILGQVEVQDEHVSDWDVQTIDLPHGAQVLSVQVQDGSPYIWACVNPSAKSEPRQFRLYGTGHPIEGDCLLKFIGTFQLFGGRLVYHLFEEVER